LQITDGCLHTIGKTSLFYSRCLAACALQPLHFVLGLPTVSCAWYVAAVQFWVCMQATADFLVNQTRQLRDDALSWAQRTDSDVAAKEHDIETVKQDHQTQLTKLKVRHLSPFNVSGKHLPVLLHL
jgi:hypothetical protein